MAARGASGDVLLQALDFLKDEFTDDQILELVGGHRGGVMRAQDLRWGTDVEETMTMNEAAGDSLAAESRSEEAFHTVLGALDEELESKEMVAMLMRRDFQGLSLLVVAGYAGGAGLLRSQAGHRPGEAHA